MYRYTTGTIATIMTFAPVISYIEYSSTYSFQYLQHRMCFNIACVNFSLAFNFPNSYPPKSLVIKYL